jgi:hypothetical protein
MSSFVTAREPSCSGQYRWCGWAFDHRDWPILVDVVVCAFLHLRRWTGLGGPVHRFDQPGFAKIATSVAVRPNGSSSAILTIESRVALTDDESRRRFRRYWLLIGPFSALTRRMTLRMVAAGLHGPETQKGGLPQ